MKRKINLKELGLKGVKKVTPSKLRETAMTLLRKEAKIVQLRRNKENPILKANPKQDWEAGAVFNPGAVMDEKGVIHLLYRAIRSGYTKKPDYGYENYISVIGHAVSKDGIHFKQRRVLIDMTKPFDKFSAEDARITKLGKEYFITYTGLTSPAFSWTGYRPILASTKDFKKVKKYGRIGPDINNKDVVIFPEKINDKIAILQRIEPDTQIVYFDNLNQLKANHSDDYWKYYLRNLGKYSVLTRRFRWEAMKVGAGPPPIRTDEGWLLIYHATDERNVYRAGAVLLDLENPQKVMYRATLPILEPKKKYERKGDVPNVVFPTGAVVKDGQLLVYYGAADKVCCLATCDLKKLLKYIMTKHSKVLGLMRREELILKRKIIQNKIKLEGF